MTELGLLLAIHVCGLAFAFAVVRFLGGRDPQGGELHRLGTALRRAVDAFLIQEFRQIAIAVAILAPLAFALYTLLLPRGAGIDRIESGLWAAVGLAIGAVSSCICARIGSRLALRASLRALSAAHKSLDGALAVSVRTGGAIGLVVETVGLLGIVFPFALVFAMKGGLRGDLVIASALAKSIAMMLPSYAIGVAVAALVIQRGGSTYHAASDIGADLAGERDAGLGHDDPRNPAVVADLVGDHVGPAAGRAVDALLSATTANVTAIIVGAGVFEALRSEGSLALGLVALPIVVRAFGVIASAFGLMVVRTDDPEDPTIALWRGQATTGIITAAGVLGSAFWLVGDPHWLRFFWAGMLGLVAVTAGAHLSRWRIDRRAGPVRELIDTLKIAEAPGVAFGLGAGFEAALIPIVMVGLAMAGAYQLGASTGLPGGSTMAILTAVATVLGSAPYMLAIGTFGPVTDGARGVSSLALGQTPAEAERRTVRLEEAGFSATTMSQSYLIVAGSVTALIAAIALPVLAGRAATIDVAKPIVVWSGALGLALVFAYAGNAVRAGTRGARSVAQEVERQLRGFPRERGRPVIPAEYTPSYRACVELTARAALHRLLLPVGIGLGVPVVLGLLIRLAYRNTDTTLASEALAAFVAMATLTGLGAALAVDAARATLSRARRASRPGGASAGFGASVGGDAVADVMGNAAGPAVQSLIKATAIVALAMAPFLSS